VDHAAAGGLLVTTSRILILMDAVVLDLVERIVSIVQQLVQLGEEAGQVIVPDPPPLGHAEHRLHEAHLCLETVDIGAQAGEMGSLSLLVMTCSVMTPAIHWAALTK